MLTVLHAGVLSSVQDGGRRGVQALGVTPGGAVDDLALQVGNLLVGNEVDAPAIEMTWQGADLHFSTDTLIALTGAPLLLRGEEHPMPHWRPVWIRAGARLSLGRMPQGARSYLCVQGGIRVAPILGGTGTDLRNGFGGGYGRALQAGDTLPVGLQTMRYAALYRALLESDAPWTTPRWQWSAWRDWWLPTQRTLPLLTDAVPVAACNALQALFSSNCQVRPQSDRQGLRLQATLPAVSHLEQRSAGVCFGLIQLPPDGSPIVLLADHQTTGGYPVVGVVAAIARSALAQARPGDRLQFRPATLADAHAALWQRECRVQYLRRLLRWPLPLTPATRIGTYTPGSNVCLSI